MLPHLKCFELNPTKKPPYQLISNEKFAASALTLLDHVTVSTHLNANFHN